MNPCAPRAHQFFELEDLTHYPTNPETQKVSEFPRVGILVKCANCGEERELWKGEELTLRPPGTTVADTPEADTDPTIFIHDAPPEQ